MYTKYTIMANGDEESTIRISKKAKNMIAEHGTVSDTYESVIVRVFDHYKKCNKVKKNDASR